MRADKHLQHNRPDIFIVYEKKKECQIIDVACPGNSRAERKEDEKIEKYRDLAIEIKTICKLKAVIVALGTIPRRLEGTAWKRLVSGQDQ